MEIFKKIMWALLAVVMILFVATSLLNVKWPPKIGTKQPEIGTKLDVRKYAIEKLVEHDWDSEAAQAVWEINEEFLTRIAELDIRDLDKELVQFYKLGRPEIQPVLTQNPEYATLFCSVMDVDINGPQKIINTLPIDEDGQSVIAFLYQLNASPGDAVSIANLFQNPEWRDRIVKLIQKSEMNFEMVPYFQMLQELQLECNNPQAASTFKIWLFNIIDKYLTLNPDSDRAAELQTILAVHAQHLKDEMKQDEGFCEAFPECWRKYESLLNSLNSLNLNDEDYELYWAGYCQDTSIFQFLYKYKDENAEELYKKYGIACTEMLMSDTFLRPEAQKAREKLVQLLMSFNNSDDCWAIIMSEPHKYLGIVDLLSRGLPDDYYRVMFTRLANANQGGGENASNLISTWNSLSDKDVEKDIGLHNPGLVQIVPLYDVYCLCEKITKGREVTGLDIVCAGVDGAFTVIDVLTLGSSKPVTSTISTATKGVKVVAKGATKEFIKGGVKKVSEEAVKENASLLVRTFKQTKQLLAADAPQTTNGIDITKYVRYAFEKTNIGRETFKKWTGLEPRIFMRKDRKVLLHLKDIPQTKAGKIAGNIMCDMAAESSFENAAQTDTGQQILQEGFEFIENPKEVTLKWKKNLSMWWRLNQNNED